MQFWTFFSKDFLIVINSKMSVEEGHQQIYDSIEKGDLNTLRTLLEPPLNVDSILCDMYLFFLTSDMF